MVLKVVSSVNLKPVSMVNSDGEEFNVLAHESQFQQIQKNDIQTLDPHENRRTGTEPEPNREKSRRFYGRNRPEPTPF
ncbi:hypothetical protein INT45_001477 [Circinella minor]|uniref:Uncharacterized protein n=1 Tax=Circinella minor TaxID=1195481 RepID=A0A8H7SBZ7_9FUNG|nr:hypothetical protein INT45_001477 [Circinella minor]